MIDWFSPENFRKHVPSSEERKWAHALGAAPSLRARRAFANLAPGREPALGAPPLGARAALGVGHERQNLEASKSSMPSFQARARVGYKHPPTLGTRRELVFNNERAAYGRRACLGVQASRDVRKWPPLPPHPGRPPKQPHEPKTPQAQSLRNWAATTAGKPELRTEPKCGECPKCGFHFLYMNSLPKLGTAPTRPRKLHSRDHVSVSNIFLGGAPPLIRVP
jgi:hypothetical protein